MRSLISSETLKLRTLVLPRAVVAVAVALSGLIGFASVDIAVDRDATVTLARLAASPAQTMWFLGVIVAVLATSGDLQHRSIVPSLLQTPDRLRVMFAKLVVAGGYGGGLAALGSGTAVAVGVVTARSLGTAAPWSGDVLPTVAASTLLGALGAVLAAGLGMLVRSTAVALVTVLVWKFVVENALPIVTGVESIRRWTPSGAAEAVLSLGDDRVLLAPLWGGLLLACYAALVVAAGSFAFARREPA